MDPLCTLLRCRKLQLYIEKQFEDGSTSEQLVAIPKAEFGHNSTAAHLPIAFASVPRSLYLPPRYCPCTFLRAAFCLYAVGRRRCALGLHRFLAFSCFYSSSRSEKRRSMPLRSGGIRPTSSNLPTRATRTSTPPGNATPTTQRITHVDLKTYA